MAKKKKKGGSKKEKAEEKPAPITEEELWYRQQLKMRSERFVVLEPGLALQGTTSSAPCLRTWIPPPEQITSPAFKPPEPTPPPLAPLPHWQFIDKEDAGIITKCAREETMDIIEHLLPKCFSEINIKFTTYLLYEVVRWANYRGFEDLKVSALVGIFYNTHLYFCGSMWRNQEDIYYFFKESILLHSVLHPPKSEKIFEIHECQEGILFFCRIYLPHLPLLRMLLLPNYRLELEWQNPNPKPSKAQASKKKPKK